MATESYKTALDAAIKEYEALGEQRREIDKRLAQLAQTIGTLTRLLGHVPSVPLGLTDACRLVTRAGVPMTPLEVRDKLHGMGFDMAGYASELSAIHTVLKRLNEAGELRIVPRPSGKDAYLWQRPAVAIAISDEVADYLRQSGQTDSEKETTETMMATDLDAYRRFFAEDIQICSNLRTSGLVDALATVPRERFLAPGPWVIRGEADFQAPLRHTPGDDPRFVYHNVAVGLDPSRMLFNGAPGFVAAAIDALALEPGHRVLHIGTGSGYYTALMAHVVGSSGRVVGIEVDEGLARQAAANLAAMSSVEVRSGDGRDIGGESFDAIFVNAGVTHPEPAWLDALGSKGRVVLPITAVMTGVGAHPAGAAMANIGKGLMMLVTRTGEAASMDAKPLTFVAIYSAIGLRDDTANAEVGRAMSRMPFPPLRQFRRDPHDPDGSCWCHTAHGCWSTVGK